MNIIAIVLVFIISAVTSYQVIAKKTKVPSPSPTPIQSDPTSTPAPAPTPTQPGATPTPSATVTIKQEVKDNSIVSQTFNLADFKYPNSNQISGSDNTMNLESNDTPDLITDWYKEKIRSLGFKSKSFVQTKTNGNVLNKLVGASGNREIRVEVIKSADSPKVSINLSI